MNVTRETSPDRMGEMSHEATKKSVNIVNKTLKISNGYRVVTNQS